MLNKPNMQHIKNSKTLDRTQLSSQRINNKAKPKPETIRPQISMSFNWFVVAADCKSPANSSSR
jgi:hypothetical protein